MGIILAVDPGEKRLGLAISDPNELLARPLEVLSHKSRDQDADQIVQTAQQIGASLILVGQALDPDGQVTFQGRKSARLAGAIRSRTDIPVKLWDESGSTQAARSAQLAQGVPRKKRQGHLDEWAAAAILQSYLDSQNRNAEPPFP